jgi:NADH-quinone oxidoreductase subunit E/NADP-reducing hydrogenase subunit HndA
MKGRDNVNNETKCCCGCSQEDSRLAELMEIIEKNRETKGALIPVLHKVQTVYGYLPEDILQIVSEKLEVPMAEIYGVASFYSIFSLEPKGEHVIRVCLGTACYVKGAQLLIDEIIKDLDIEVGQTTPDGKFTLEACRCLGACGLAPVLTVGDKVYGRLAPESISGILAEYK